MIPLVPSRTMPCFKARLLLNLTFFLVLAKATNPKPTAQQGFYRFTSDQLWHIFDQYAIESFVFSLAPLLHEYRDKLPIRFIDNFAQCAINMVRQQTDLSGVIKG